MGFDGDGTKGLGLITAINIIFSGHDIEHNALSTFQDKELQAADF